MYPCLYLQHILAVELVKGVKPVNTIFVDVVDVEYGTMNATLAGTGGARCGTFLTITADL